MQNIKSNILYYDSKYPSKYDFNRGKMVFNIPPNIDKHTHYPSVKREGVMYMLKVGNQNIGREKSAGGAARVHTSKMLSSTRIFLGR